MLVASTPPGALAVVMKSATVLLPTARRTTPPVSVAVTAAAGTVAGVSSVKLASAPEASVGRMKVATPAASTWAGTSGSAAPRKIRLGPAPAGYSQETIV